MNLMDVFAPVFVGRPPTDAFLGLVRLENGDIRYYNYGWDASLPPPPAEGSFYIESKDNGFTWAKRMLPEWQLGADQRSPKSGDYIRLARPRSCSHWGMPCPYQGCSHYNGYRKFGDQRDFSDYNPAHDCRGLVVIRRHGNIDGACSVSTVIENTVTYTEPKPPVFIRNGKRILVGIYGDTRMVVEGFFTTRGKVAALYSDDDGYTWKVSNELTIPFVSPFRPSRLNHGPWEPTLVELADGRIWMLMRTGRETFYESYSMNGGETWDAPRPSRFYATKTMPTLGRLKDGRILLVWCNTTPLPEISRNEATRILMGSNSEADFFTNRDAAHAAISEDDGKTWHGFRELLLDARRNAGDYALTGGHDRGIHQSQFVELGDNKILVALGQHHLHRSMLIFDVNWLYEKERREDFSNELDNWSVQSYVAGVKGHLALNRKPGARLVAHPNKPDRKVLRIARIRDPELISEKQGAVWNFPAGIQGALTLRLMVPSGSQGVRVSLVDRWINPTDDNIEAYAMFSVKITGEMLSTGEWHDIRFEWNKLSRKGSDTCRLLIDGIPSAPLPLGCSSVNGICYVHFISTAEAEDKAGVFVESAHARLI